MDSNFHCLPPLKRFRLLQQQHELESESEIVPKPLPLSPSNLPAKKRKHSRYPVSESNEPFEKENIPPCPITCLPAKKRIWAMPIQPHSSPIKSPPHFDLNLDYNPDVEVENDDDDDDDGIECAVCESTDADPMDPIVFCDGCDLMVHSSCYGNPLTKSIPEGEWFCLQCSDSSCSKRECCLCPESGGAMKETVDGKWAHIVCAVLVPEVFFKDAEGRDEIDCSRVPKRRWKGKCYLCKGKTGCVVECSEINCEFGFHVTCGLKEDLCIELKQPKTKTKTSIVAAFCKNHTRLWEKQKQTGKFKIVARDEELKV